MSDFEEETKDESMPPATEDDEAEPPVPPVEEEEEEEPAPEAPMDAPEADALNKRVTTSEYLSELLGMSTVTKDATYNEARAKFVEYQKSIKSLKGALSGYGEKCKAMSEASSTMRVIATQTLIAEGNPAAAWGENRVGSEVALAETSTKASECAKMVHQYYGLLKSILDKTDKTVLKARRDGDYYQKKVETLTKKVMKTENSCASRAEREDKMRKDAEAKREPPPTKTHYFYEDPLPVATEKLEKLKQRLARNEHKLEVAKVWQDRSVNLGALTFTTAVDENDMEIVPILQALVELDASLKQAAEATFLPSIPDPTSAKPLADRLADAKINAGFDKTDVDPQESLDQDDEEDAQDHHAYLCGY